jgi:hypothetical protein
MNFRKETDSLLIRYAKEEAEQILADASALRQDDEWIRDYLTTSNYSQPHEGQMLYCSIEDAIEMKEFSDEIQEKKKKRAAS